MSLRSSPYRWLVWLIVACAGIFVILHVANAIKLNTSELTKGAQALIDRAESVRDRAIPEYQDLALATLPANPNIGPFYRFDDNLPLAKTIKSSSSTQLDENSKFEFKLEFDEGNEPGLVSARGKTTLEQRDGMMIVTHRDDDYLITEKPLSIPLENISEIVIRARADRGNRFELRWAAEGRESRLNKNRLSLDLISDGEFHTYIVNAQNALRRGVGFDENISLLSIKPSNVDGATVEIDFIRIVSKKWKYQVEQAGTSYETVDGELRPVLHMMPNQQLEYTVDIPDQDPELSFGAASLLNKPPIEVSIYVKTNEESTRIYGTAKPDSEHWQDETVDLSPWAGQTVRIVYEVRGSSENIAFFSNPMIRSAVQRRFNVIVILEDALRADHLSTYGYARETSPAKTRFMKKYGTMFLNAHSQATKTRPSVPSLMTSLYASATGVWNFSESLSDRYLTLAEILRSQGFVTASFIQNGNAGPYAGLHQGFSSLHHDADKAGHTTEDLLGEQVFNWLDQNGDHNFFLYLHAIDPHGEYDPPPPYDRWYREAPAGSLVGEESLPRSKSIDPEWAGTASGEARRLLYDGEIRHNDKVIDSFIKELGKRNLLEDTLLVFVSDHGEWLGEDGLWEHEPPGKQPVIHVPFMVSYPRVFDTPQQIEESVQLIDAMPTILELASVDSSDLLMHGDSLVSLIKGNDLEHWQNRVTISEEPTLMTRDDPCACGSLFFGPWQLHGSRMGWPYKSDSPFIKTAVYRFREDGLNPVASYLPDLHIRYLRHKTLSDLVSVNMETWRKITAGQQQDVYKMDPDTLEKLRGLGYVN